LLLKKKWLWYINNDKLVLISEEKNSSKLVLACVNKLKTIEKKTKYLTDLICVNENRWWKIQGI